ncbi:MAG TPA: hypothetical protein DE315_06595 [Candidatus Omnitrophica bacterium]|nr:MAG: hypothetical protein A2Y05_04315 [Omnitrophica WOR_2 bacterium GWA2_53_43]HBO96683.1 hypothetical protein [Candidatus Omnitrophota bacterium]HCI45178.1 hypothetical protein [Candidatus Omnitrophota bacterium]
MTFVYNIPTMFRILYFFFLGSLFLLTTGCAQLTETAKKIWGSSTAALERARVDGLRKTYTCAFAECYDAVLGLARTEEEQEAKAKQEEEAKKAAEETGGAGPGQELGQPQKSIADNKFFDIFLKDPHQKHIVVIGVSGNVDTTEVGIFLEEAGPSAVKVEISSLSSTAKRRVAQAVFEALDKRFSPAS